MDTASQLIYSPCLSLFSPITTNWQAGNIKNKQTKTNMKNQVIFNFMMGAFFFFFWLELTLPSQNAVSD